jgi:integrase
MVPVPKAFTGTKRVRKYFATKDEAGMYIARIIAGGYVHADTREVTVGKTTVGECAEVWMARHEDKKPTLKQIRQPLSSLIARHGRDAIDQITHVHLDAWLRSIKLSPTTKHNYFRITRRFFSFCHQWLEVIPRNPMMKVPRPKKEFQDPEILTPKQMQACLDVAEAEGNLPLIAYLCLGGFAGIRTEEILRMDWDDFNWTNGEVWVRKPKKVGGWRPRSVEMLPALRRHLDWIAPKTAHQITIEIEQQSPGHPTRKVVPGGQRSLYLARRAMMDKLGWKEWPYNCLRHSYKSYHLAVFQDLEKLRVQMGHSDQNMTRYNYGAPEVRAVAEQWWAL